MSETDDINQAIALLQAQIANQETLVALEKERRELEARRVIEETAKHQLELERLSLEKSNEKSRQALITAERNRIKLQLDQNEKLDAMLQVTGQVVATIMAVREWQDEAANWMDAIDRILLLQLARRGQGSNQENSDLTSELNHLSKKRELIQRTDNLNRLREEKARVGFDLRLENEIKTEETEIDRLKEELANEQ